MVAIPEATPAGSMKEGSHPSPSRPHLRSSDAAEPLQPYLEGLLERLGEDADTVQVEPWAVVVDHVLRPEAADQGERLVEPSGAVGPRHAERLLFGRVRDAEPEGRKQAATRQPVEAGHCLGAEDGVATRQYHHGWTQLEALGAAGGIGHGDHRVERLAGCPFAHPEGVVAEPFQVGHHRPQQAMPTRPGVVGPGLRGGAAESEAYANPVPPHRWVCGHEMAAVPA
jgi:hypothetical protein